MPNDRVLSFNSNMVRLRPATSVEAREAAQLFQFQYGAIKTSLMSLADCFISRFNSNMVRLRQVARIASLKQHKFQFQYGAIKTISNNYRNRTVLLFQFQYGAIKTVQDENQRHNNKVSIPIWCD